MAEGKIIPKIVPGEIAVEGVSKSYGALHLRKEVVHECSFKIERAKLTVMSAVGGKTIPSPYQPVFKTHLANDHGCDANVPGKKVTVEQIVA